MNSEEDGMSRISENSSGSVRVDVVGALSDRQRAYLTAKIDSLTQYALLRAAHVVVGETTHEGGSVSVRVNLSGDRVLAHAEAAGATFYEAVDIARQRLYLQLTNRHGHGHTLRSKADTRTP